MNPPALTADDFSAFFRELWGADYDPFPWQREFARRLCAGQLPDYVAVPTGSGKTACLDAAVFALAVQTVLPMAERTQGRRIFFIVNRRVIVDEAYERAGRLCKRLREVAPESVTGRVAAALRKLSGEVEAAPLARAQLRGGIYRDRSWAGSLLQPMIICSTVDQVGSRLLFRGYGVSPQARPIHAALVAQDSLLIIDEAHISRPFIQTLEWVKRYRLHQPAGCETVQLPFQLIQMTATPPADTRDDQKITLNPEDHEHPVLKPRLCSAKPTRLVIEPKAKGKNREERNKQLANRLVGEAEKLLADEDDPPRSIAIMVNRVATARSIADEMQKEHEGRVKLLIGRLRPFDREALTKEIQQRLKTGATPSAPESAPLIVVSTQCLEVGADLDFDALVTEAASLDALRQRFGRLNRGGREVAARAVIVLPGDQDLPAERLDEAAPCDPIYGNAIPRTWRWLNGLAQDGVVDFGINAMTAAVDSLRATGTDEALAAMLSPTTDAPVLLPAYLDCWVQTNPSPAADPDVALFLHGPQRDMAEVQVCWRGDLPEATNEEEWTNILSLCPPTSAECLTVPLHIFRNWMGSQGEFKDDSADVVEREQEVGRNRNEETRGIPALVWRRPDERFFTQRGAEVRPGDTIVLRVQSGGWQALGHLPGAPDDPQTNPGKELGNKEVRLVDVAESGIAATRRRAILRIHPLLWPVPESGTPAAELKKMALDREQDWRVPEIRELLERLLNEAHPGWALTEEQRNAIKHLTTSGVRLMAPEPYPNSQGFVLTARDLLPEKDADGNEELAGTEADALLEAAQPQELCNHTKDVLARLESVLALLPLATWREALIAAAAAHDWGKIDPRFQALLRGTTPFAAMASGMFLAKSGSIASSTAARRAAREFAELPQGFRHEMLSVQMAENPVGTKALPMHPVHHALALHLIATHHGYGRPLAPLVDDEAPPGVSLSMNGKMIAITGAERLEHPTHALDSGIAERFWQMNRHYGWWGIALLEAVLRLADQSASANPQPIPKP
jgi:CRISPR-associated endonuclease/helicase Cas3